MIKKGKSTRFKERVKMSLPLEVHYYEEKEKAWAENTHTEQITVCGIGFTLSRPVEPKRMLRLAAPVPKKFRLFDYGKDQYDVWGIVANLQLIQSEDPRHIRLLVGTALTGAHPPASFFNNPKTLYDLKPILRDGNFWEVRELPRRPGPFGRSFEERRPMESGISLEFVDEQGRISGAIRAETLNISESGAAVVAADVNAGKSKYAVVRKSSNFALLAAVRGVNSLESGGVRLHLEFISGEWKFD